MKFKTLAQQLDYSVGDLAEKVKDILPGANGGTEVTEEQKTQIVALVESPDSTGLSLLEGGGSDPILALLIERIADESRLETPEEIVNEMVARYAENPEDLPDDLEYRAAIVTYVDLVKKRQLRRQQQSSRLRSLLSRSDSGNSTAEPLVLDAFYSVEPSATGSSAKLNGNARPPQLSASSS